MDFNELIEKSQREIEPKLSSLGYRFTEEIRISGPTFACNYINQEEKKKLQIIYELYERNAFCKQFYETDMED